MDMHMDQLSNFDQTFSTV